MIRSSLSLSEVVLKAKRILDKKGIRTARLDSELLLAHALGIERVGIYRDYTRRLTNAELKRFFKLVNRRARFEPVSYIRGNKEFFSLEFGVNRHVMAPRPETELLVEKSLEFIAGFDRSKKLRVADIGTGSGAIAVSIAERGRERVRITAVDICRKALILARENAKKNGVARRIRFSHSDIFGSVKGKFDLVVSNPPYVKTGELERLARDIVMHEPRKALDGGKDGLKFISILIRDGIRFLNPGGMLLIEIGKGHAKPLKKNGLLDRYSEKGFYNDGAGVERVIYLKK